MRRLGLAALLAASMVSACAPQGTTTVAASADEKAAYAQVKPLLERHCLMCHSERPPIALLRSPPAGVVLETPEELRKFAPRIAAMTAITHVMPPANFTGMTETDREALNEVLRKEWLHDR
ncbi:MAG: hypothetical protein ACHP7N_01590 [Caulobacterales bacterium]